jgi:hypothetical protein
MGEVVAAVVAELPVTAASPRSVVYVGGVYGARRTSCCMPPAPTSLYSAA